MQPPLDLDDIEAKARAAKEEAPGRWSFEPWLLKDGDGDMFGQIDWRLCGYYIAAMPPDVALAMVARIKELEAELQNALTCAVCGCGMCDGGDAR